LRGGAIIPIYPGDKLQPFTPGRPANAFYSFVTGIFRHIAVGLNLPYELLLKDFSKTNYSSARAALLEAWRFFNSSRQWLSSLWATPVYELWLEESINAGLIDAPGFFENREFYMRCKWIGPGRGWIDPVKEAQAAEIRMDSGLSTLEDECADQGRDWVEVLEQRAREREVMRSLGLLDAAVRSSQRPLAVDQAGNQQEERVPA
ncbi:MAG TPA: phage portal protein, partial [Candidatus Glassbacteria bacterium]|nr:phage portal protein [Candidatus Glassbacteria bacterium]